MIVLNLLMFSTIMILMMAVGPYGNHLAAALATTALVLVLFVSWLTYKKKSGATIKRRRGFFFSLSSSEERKKEERINGRRHTNHGDDKMKMGNGQVADLAEKAQKAAAEIMQTSALVASKISGKGDLSDTAYIGTMTALGAMIPTAMCFGNKPKLTKEEIEERGQEEAFKLVNPETLLFTALLASHTLVSITADGGTSFEFGPHVLYEALLDWEKLTGKSPDGIFDAKMLKAARDAGSGASLPLEMLRAKRAQAHGGNGSVN